jgi:hypothetical protein
MLRVVHFKGANDLMHSRFVRVLRMLPVLAMVAMLAISTVASPVASAASTCVYYVRVFAYVRESPSLNARILKSKGAFARVTGPCRERNGFIAVYLAEGGIGWIDAGKLY